MKRKAIIVGLLAFLLVGCNKEPESEEIQPVNKENEEETFTVTWKNYDGTMLEIDENVPSGSTPSYNGKKPTKERDGSYRYTFSNWSPELSPVVTDITYIAEFSKIFVAAHATYDLNGGTTNSNSQSRYIYAFDKDCFFYDVKKENYIFVGWEYNGEKVFDEKGNKIKDVQLIEEMTFKAMFVDTGHLEISSSIDDAGIITGAGDYRCNSNATLSVETNDGFTFDGWYYDDGTLISKEPSCSIKIVDENVKVRAVFNSISHRLFVKSYNDDVGRVSLKDYAEANFAELDYQIEYQTKLTLTARKSMAVDFLGWFDKDGNLVSDKITYEFTMPNSDYELEAVWNYFHFEVSSNDDKLGTVNETASTYKLNEKVNLVASPKIGCEFVGWYLNDRDLISTSSSYEYSMPRDEANIVARFKVSKFNVNVYSSESTRGSVGGSGDYKYGEYVTLHASPVEGSSFAGWYMNNELISNGNPYTFSIGTTDLQIEGRFVGISYTLSFETNGGDPIGNITGEKGTPIVVRPNRDGYVFKGWHTDSSCSSESLFELGDEMPMYSGTLYADWSLATYLITYHLSPRVKNNSMNPATFTILSDTIVLQDPEIENGTFEGWYSDSQFKNRITTIEKGTLGSINIYEKESSPTYTISFVSNGGNSVNPITKSYKDNLIIPTPKNGNKIFVGWFSDKELTQRPYITTMPNENTTLYAKWADMYVPFEIGTEQYIYFGMYPQSIVTDSKTKIALLNYTGTLNERGYYEYNGEEYTKKRVNLYSDSYLYSNGAKPDNLNDEFFKVEPILWRIIDIDSAGNYTLLADKAINTCVYDAFEYPNNNATNNYEDSIIRRWINNDFYNIAFNDEEKEEVLITNVDNSPATTMSLSNAYTCENTNDKVFLLSYADYKNSDYGYIEDSYGKCDLRLTRVTDYALANYAYHYDAGLYNGCTYVWTRSPSYEDEKSIHVVFANKLSCLNYAFTCYGVCPAIRVKL